MFAIDEQHALPVRAAVGGLEDAALFLRAGQPARRRRRRRCSDSVGWMRTREMRPVSWQAHVLPGLAGVLRYVDAVAHDVAVADHPRLAGADPDDVRIAVGARRSRRWRRRAGRRRSARRSAAVGGLPDAARRGAEVVGVGIAGHAGDRGDAARRARVPCSGTSAARASWPAAARWGRRRAARTTTPESSGCREQRDENTLTAP